MFSPSFAAHALCLALACFLGRSNAQAGPNTLAVYNPNIRTLSVNDTYFIVPINSTTLQHSVPYPLIPVNDKTIFPNGFPAGMHPLLVVTGYEADIRMFDLEIDSLMGGQIQVPFVDRLGDGKTPFIYPVASLVGGTNGQTLMGVVPAVVGSLEGTTTLVGSFLPDTAAYQPLANGQYSSQVKNVIIPNPLSGPGVVPSVADLLFTTATKSEYTPHTFHALLDAPLIQNNGECQNNIFYFNQTFTGGTMRTGSVTLYSGAIPAALAGVYNNVGGYSANPIQVGYNAQSCADAAAAIVPQQ